jgi:hypothetical protein
MGCQNRVRKWWSLWFKVSCGGTPLTRCKSVREKRQWEFMSICWRCSHVEDPSAKPVSWGVVDGRGRAQTN